MSRSEDRTPDHLPDHLPDHPQIQPNDLQGSPVHDRYQLIQRLGARGAKQTWLATDLSSGSQVTLKLLSFGVGMEWQDFKLFEREGQTLQALDHPRIPRYIDVFQQETPRFTQYGLVQHYIPGRSLAEVVRAGQRFSQAEVVRIATGILEILIYLHSCSPIVIHRDIKPSNLIQAEETDDQGNPLIYLIDFGSVQAEAASGRTATVVGTYGYMPMEQFGGRAVPASDLYALGATLVFLMTGTDPADLPQTTLKPQLGSILSVEPGLRRWLEGMVEPSLEQRFQSASAALEGLRSRDLMPYKGVNLAPDSEAQPPAKTQIEIDRSPQQLRIMIPPRKGGTSLGYTLLAGFSILQLVVTGLRLITSLAFLFSSFGAVSLIINGVWVAIWWSLARYALKHQRRNWGYNTIEITPESFKISWSHFGPDKLPHRTQTGSTPAVEGVEVALGHDEGEICLMTRTETGMEMFPAALGLTTQERYWLVSQIREWLATHRSRSAA